MWNRDKLMLPILFTVALAIRLWFIVRLQADPVFCMPVSDPKEFNYWAFQIFHSHWLWHDLPHHMPLYAYFVALVYKVFSFHVTAVAVVQSVLGAFSACLMYILVRRMIGAAAAVVCSGFMAAYWFFVYTQVYLFSESLAMFLNIVLIFHLTVKKDSLGKYFMGGILLGLSSACRPEVLPFGLIILWWLWQQSKNWRRCGIFYGAFFDRYFNYLDTDSCAQSSHFR